jgi:hypothetical protein
MLILDPDFAGDGGAKSRRRPGLDGVETVTFLAWLDSLVDGI